MKLTNKIAVIGGGSWATAIAKMVLSRNTSIYWYMRREDRIADFKSLGHNPAYLTSIRFKTRNIQFSSDINWIVSQADTLIFATPSPYLKQHLSKLTEDLSGKTIVSAIKGIVPEENMIVSQYFQEVFKVPEDQIISLA